MKFTKNGLSRCRRQSWNTSWKEHGSFGETNETTYEKEFVSMVGRTGASPAGLHRSVGIRCNKISAPSTQRSNNSTHLYQTPR